MAGSPVLIDSSWYITGSKRGRNPLRELAPIAEVRDLATCGIVRAEVARGIRERGALEKFQSVWDVMMFVPTDNRLWTDVETMAWRLDRTIGGAIPLADIIIACCALRIGAVILTFDKHFEQIPGIVATDRIV